MKKPFENNYNITQKFGENPSIYAQFGLRGHNGIDFAVPNNTDILSPITGKIIEVGWDEKGYGLYMKIENEKEGCLLAHLRDNLLAISAECSEGQLIAHSDNTGNSTGPHLHFGYYLLPRDRSNGYAGYIDPMPYLFKPQITINQDLYEKLITMATQWKKIADKLNLDSQDNEGGNKAIETIDNLAKKLKDNNVSLDTTIKEPEVIKTDQGVIMKIPRLLVEGVIKLVKNFIALKW